MVNNRPNRSAIFYVPNPPGVCSVNLPGASAQPSPSAAKARNFAESLGRRITLPIHLADERFSSAAAEEELKEAGLCSRKRKNHLDSQAAVLILEGWLALQGAARS